MERELRVVQTSFYSDTVPDWYGPAFVDDGRFAMESDQSIQFQPLFIFLYIFHASFFLFLDRVEFLAEDEQSGKILHKIF